MDENCLICELPTGSEAVSRVTVKGMNTLLSASLTRRDGKDNVFRGRISGIVHVTCRKHYTRPADVERAGKSVHLASTSGVPSLRSSKPQFQFQGKCLFCAESIDEKFYEKQKKMKQHLRRAVYNVRTTEFDKTLAKQAHIRNDDCGKDVLQRICNVSDLHAADGMYHEDCRHKFFCSKPQTGQKRGRPQVDYVFSAMEEIFHYLDGNDKVQYSMDDLMNQVSGEKPELKWVKTKLKEKYGDRIIFSTVRSHKTVVCFRDVGESILNAAWYAGRLDNEEEENLRFVRTAGAIIRKQIQSQAYDISKYPPSDAFLNEAAGVVPPTLLAFMESLVIPKKSLRTDDIMRKIISISHSIISVVRPRSFISSVLTSIAYLIHRKFGSKNLINLLANLGFSASYHHTQQLETSTLYQHQKTTPANTFCQYVYDNADFNIATLDGRNTFHNLGGIKCVTPAEALPKSDEIERMKSPPDILEVGKFGVLNLESYENVPQNGLKNVFIQDVNTLNPIPGHALLPSLEDTLWMCSKSFSEDGISHIPEWKGFMGLVCKQINITQTAIVPLPFINSPPSADDTLYTALRYASEDATRLGLTACFVTMDQPLYLKSRKIIASNALKFNNIKMVLGGFHMLLSFLGCIGHTMAGSGMKELLCCIFAPNSVDKILSGKAYSRAVRGHLLVQTILSQIILESATFTTEDKQVIVNMLLSDEEWSPEKVSSNALTLTRFQKTFSDELSKMKDKGPTAALWVQYFQMVNLMKKFITAQRCGDWGEHLSCAQQMIPYFHACGHFHYAKCTHLYVQDMLPLTKCNPGDHQLYEQYTDFGFFSVNRTGNRWAGLWSDMTIEQTLMCDMKSEGGLTRGRGLTDSVLAKWIAGAGIAASICSCLEMFAGTHNVSGEQHVDLRESRIKRNADDRAKLADWLANRPPFAKRDHVISLSTGVIGDSKINCHQALEIGSRTMQAFIGLNIADMKQSKKNTVVPLSAMSNTVKVHNEAVVVDTSVIFQRTLISKKSDEDVADLLRYELSPYPMTLFDEGWFRKTKKSALYEAFPLCSDSVNLKTIYTVVDGGFLLHRVKWNIGTAMSFICEQYASYIINHYSSNCTVIFDGYEDINSIKRAEQKRREASKTSVHVNVSGNMVADVQQEIFLTSALNKTRLIDLLVDRLKGKGIETCKATGDADGIIVRCAIEKATSHSEVAVIGEDIDLLVLLVALTPPNANIRFIKPGRGKTETKTYSTLQLQGELPYCSSILFIHSFSGCDTTSAIFGKSKHSILKSFQKLPDETKAIAEVFYNPSSTNQQVAQAGEAMFLILYNAPPNQKDLNEHRYSCFVKSSTKVKANLASLPPTKAAAAQHAHRVFLQTQIWLGNTTIDPQAWGWVRDEHGILTPVKSSEPPAPDHILNSIFCRCATGCNKRCGCRKAGIHCSPVCGCEGVCLNRPPVLEEDMYEDSDDEIIQSSLF